MEVTLTKDNFNEEVITSNIPVLIDFWATWCGPCMMLSPIVEEVANELEGKVKVCKVNIDEQEELAAQYGIMVIPTLLIIKDGKVIKKTTGYMSKEELLEFINN